MDESLKLIDSSTSDLENSVVFISDIDDSLLETSLKSTPGAKRKRDFLAEVDEIEKKEDAEFLELDDSNEDSSSDMEPRRKRPSVSSRLSSEPKVPDVVKDTNFDDNLPATVTLLRTEDGGKVYLVGTAHFSVESQNDVSKVINTVKPQRVVVELCSARTDIILFDEQAVLAAAQDLNFQKVMNIIKQNGAVQGLLYLTLLQMSAHVTKELGMAPGGEFRCALKEAQNLGDCIILLGDRPINITISRLFASLSWWQTAKFLWSVVLGKESIKKEDVENAKKQDVLEAMIGEMGDEFPSMKEVLVTERDIFLTYSLQNAVTQVPNGTPNQLKVVGVVGIGHAQGIKELWGKVTEDDIARIMTIPPQSLSSKVIRVTLRVAFFGGLAYAAYKIGVNFRRIPLVGR